MDSLTSISSQLLAAFGSYDQIERTALRADTLVIEQLREKVRQLGDVCDGDIPASVIPGKYGSLFDGVFQTELCLLDLIISEAEGSGDCSDESVREAMTRVKKSVIGLAHSLALTEQGVVLINT
jgi:hypothetical protein